MTCSGKCKKGHLELWEDNWNIYNAWVKGLENMTPNTTKKQKVQQGVECYIPFDLVWMDDGTRGGWYNKGINVPQSVFFNNFNPRKAIKLGQIIRHKVTECENLQELQEIICS